MTSPSLFAPTAKLAVVVAILAAANVQAQFDLGRIINRARQAAQPRSSRRVPRTRTSVPNIGRQFERAAMQELQRRAPRVARIVREVTDSGYRTLPVRPPVVEPLPVVEPRRRNRRRTATPARQAKPAQPDLSQLPGVSEGETVALDADDLGDKAGRVLVKFSGLTLKAKVLEWQTKQTLVQLPKIGIQEPARAEIQIHRADGKPAESLPVRFEPAKAKARSQTVSQDQTKDESALPSVVAGEEVALDGDQLGTKAGSVTLSVGPLTLKAPILDWQNNAVSVRIPRLPLDKAAVAKIQVRRANGEVASAIDVRFEPAAAGTPSKK